MLAPMYQEFPPEFSEIPSSEETDPPECPDEQAHQPDDQTSEVR